MEGRGETRSRPWGKRRLGVERPHVQEKTSRKIAYITLGERGAATEVHAANVTTNSPVIRYDVAVLVEIRPMIARTAGAVL
jgi:hypothetical protein